MLMAVKNQMRVCALAVKYNIMREMLNNCGNIVGPAVGTFL